MRAEKQFLVDEVAGHLAKSSYLLVANFTKVTVKDATEIRNHLRPLGAEYHVVKNSILAIAAKKAALPDLSAHLSGHTALVTGGDNPSAVAKVLVKFFKDFARLEVKAGVLDAKLLSAAEIKELAMLPSLDVIRAQLLSLLSTPATSVVRILVAKNEAAEKAATPAA
jgi:large subunit ribosomal protein L10